MEMNRTIPLKLLLIAAVVSTNYMNCAKLTARPYEDSSLASQEPADDSGGLDAGDSDPVASPEEYSTADSSGRILASQDLMFRFAIPEAEDGTTYSLQGAPSWLSVSPARPEIRGVPPSVATHSGVRILATKSGQTTTLGPYEIEVIGDPMKQHQWHLKNTGQSTFAGLPGVAGHDIQLFETIRDRILGQGVRIAISDSGVLESHPGLSPNLIPGASRNYKNNYASTGSWLGSSSPSTSVANDAHGTAVAGLALERGWLGLGGRGVAPMAKFAGFQFIQAQESLASSGYAEAGFHDQFSGDFDIFNYSWGDYQCALLEYGSAYFQKVKAGVTGQRGGKGSIFLKAAGNEYWGYLDSCDSNASSEAYYLGNTNFSEESVSPYILLVGAVNAKGVSATYSTPGSGIWISAPGGETGWARPPSSATTSDSEPALLTTDFVGCTLGMKTHGRDYNDFDAGSPPNGSCTHTSGMNGTSGAVPIVSGAVALMLSANSSLTWRDVKHILAVTADKVHANAANTAHPAQGYDLAGHVYQQGWVKNAAGYNFHNWYGFGRVNVDRAVKMAKTYTSELGPFKETNSGTTWKYDSGAVNATVAGGVAAGVSRTLSVSENYFIEAIQVQVSAAQCIGNLGIEVTSPSGTKSILMNINSFIADATMDSHIFLTNAFYGERSAGTWTLKLVGGAQGCDSTWNSWQLNVIGH